MDPDIAAEFARLHERIAGLERQLHTQQLFAHNAHRDQLAYLRRLQNSRTTYLGDHTALTYLTNGYRCLVDTRDRAVGMHLMHGGYWEHEWTEAFKRMIGPGSVVVDVGANLGWYTLVAAPIVGRTGRVIAIEPNPRLTRLLFDSVYNNGFSGWTRVLQCAVSDAPGLVDLVSHQQSPGGGQIVPTDFAVRLVQPAVQRVAAMPLDTLLADEPPVDVLKIDIEGWEGMALRGMAATFDRSPALRILMEWSPAQDGTPAPRPAMAAEFERRGYLPFLVAPDATLRRLSWDAATREPALVNIVVLRAEDSLAAEAS